MTAKTDSRIAESMRRDAKRSIMRGVLIPTCEKPMELVGDQVLRIERSMKPARFLRGLRPW